MNPLQVMRTALQLHQSGLSPGGGKEKEKEREPFLVMPDLPVPSTKKSYVLEEDKLDHLCGAFPGVARSTLASLLIHEKGDINGVISSWMISEEERSRERSNYEDVVKKEDLAVADVAAKTAISKQELKSILDNAKAQESATGVNILSFHSRAPRQQVATATCTSSTSTKNTESDRNAFSRALSAQKADNRICPTCLNFVERDFSFCPHCGQLLKKNYRRL